MTATGDALIPLLYIVVDLGLLMERLLESFPVFIFGYVGERGFEPAVRFSQ